MTPITVKTLQGDDVQVPCNRCPACVSRRVSHWSFRLMQEFKASQNGYFITLTYDTKHVPISPKGFMTLRRRDVQLFMKRLRKASQPQPTIKYYSAGEYGTKTKRPHYHILLFNVNIELLQKAWGLGSIHYGKLTAAAVGYTLKYMSKPSRIPEHKNDDREPERALMSKGLGISYINERTRTFHLDNIDRPFITIADGKKISIPRYFKEKLFTEEEREYIAIAGRDMKFDQFTDILINQFNNDLTAYDYWYAEAKEQAFRMSAKNYYSTKKD